MSWIVLVARLVLAAVFVASALGKARDRVGTRAALAGFGVPARWVPAGSLLLPLAELTVGVLLLIPAAAAGGGVGALVLLSGFSVAIAANLGRGRTPDCHCFGRLRSAPISTQLIWRNAALAVLALVVLLGA